MSHAAQFLSEAKQVIDGLNVEAIEGMAAHIHRGKRVSFWWTMGVNQSHEGVNVAEAIIALALMTGNIGRPGTGANSITGQCNAMGSRLFSNTTNLLGGHDFTREEHRRKVAQNLIRDIQPEALDDINAREARIIKAAKEVGTVEAIKAALKG